MKPKKTLSLILAMALLCLCAAGCQSGSATNDSSGQSSENAIVLDGTSISAGSVADLDLRIVAKYKDESIPDTSYTVAFKIEYGELSKGSLTYGELSQDGKTYTFTAEPNEYATMANAFIALNSNFADVYEVDRVYTFGGWGMPIIDVPSRTARYSAEWSFAVRKYTITFDGGDGYQNITNAELVTISGLTYGSTGFLPEEGGFVKDDDYGSYILTGWEDENGKVHLPGVKYTVTGDMTYTAVYGVDAKKEYTVIFQYLVSGGEWSTITRTYGYNETITDIPSPPTVTDDTSIYTFTGKWEIYGEGIELGVLPSVTGNAHYMADYTVSAIGGGDGADG